MATERTLTSLLQAYQTVADSEQTNKILSTTTYLFTTLSNPLNITLLTSHFLVAPAIWDRDDDSRAWLRIMGILNTAAVTIQKHTLDMGQKVQPRNASIVKCDEWARAVIKGADERSPRWRHLLLIGGILSGMEGQNRQGLSRGLRTSLEGAMVVATNIALDQSKGDERVTAAIVLALTHTFDLLSDDAKGKLNYDALAPATIRSITGVEGYQQAHFLGAINIDLNQATENRIDWSSRSLSFTQIQRIASKPLVLAMGSLSRLAAHCMSSLNDSKKIEGLLDEISIFAFNLSRQWRESKLSELNSFEEAVALTHETFKVTVPTLWQVLKTAMFAIVNILRAVIARSLVDPLLAVRVFATAIASKTLHTLRSIYFISSRLGLNTFSAYTFTNLTAIDILSHFPAETKAFLVQIRPAQPGRISSQPLDRNLDLFFLNTCEHFTLVLNAEDNEDLIVGAASPYLNPDVRHGLVEIFEAAHSAILAVLAAPQNAALTAYVVPFYVETLFCSFPVNLTPRQFRFAFRNLFQITTPPAPLSAVEPFLADTLMELLYHRASSASTLPLLPARIEMGTAGVENNEGNSNSEQAVLMLTILDAMPFLTPRSLKEWLPLSAELLNSINDYGMRATCRARFWEVLESGEMDVDRAAICVAWWTTRGGRDVILYGRRSVDSEKGPFMTGGLGLRENSYKL